MCFFGSKPAPPMVIQQPPPPPQMASLPIQQHPQQHTTEIIRQEVPSPAKVVHSAGTIDPYIEEGGKRTKSMQKKAKKSGLGQFRIPLDDDAKSALTAPTLYPQSGLNIPV